MKAFVSLFLISLSVAVSSYAQAPVNYNDVGVIINVNDTNSVAIGEYFAAQRAVPARNIIRIDAPARETITPGQFDTVRAQIEAYLIATGLVDTLNYFVTTKGVPLRVNVGSGDDKNASFDAEIMLILGDLAGHIGQSTLFIPPNSVRTHYYFSKDVPYRRSGIVPNTNPPRRYDMFLTTRLTGLTQQDVRRLIDRSGPFTLVDKDSALFVFDRDPRPIQLVPYDSNLAIAGQLVASRGWNALVNHDSVYVTDQRNVIGYASWGSNDHYDHHYTENARPHNHWLPGSLAETYVSTSARNFIPGQVAGQSRIADLIEEGCTGASGYVFEPYTVALTWVNLLFDRYLRGYNLAESYYMSNPTLSWMAVIVGDPKTSIITEIPPVPAPGITAPDQICAGETLFLRAQNVSPGWQRWFTGDSLAVLAAGPPFDDTHPLHAGESGTLSIRPTQEGDVTYTFLNENFIGRAFAQTTVTVLPELVVAYSASADTLFLDESATVQFSAAANGAVAWEWLFGDGATSTDSAPSHTYIRAGNFPVTVRVSDGVCETTVRDTIHVLDRRPAVRPERDVLAFGDVVRFSQIDRSLRMHNELRYAADIESASIEGPDASVFTLAPVSFPATIGPGGNIDLTITFAPKDTGLFQATLVLAVSSQSAPIPVQLTGRGIESSTGVGDAPASPLSLRLDQNYPNPFAPVTSIPFFLPSRGAVRLSVYDALGRCIAVLVDDELEQGPHTVLWDATDVPAGTLLCVLEADGMRITRRMNILH
ncbi:MAG: TIGR03790 family protein [Bacteroidetes bacterium]|nr:TIGR03790 family protein [Bacteroidota bacterium]